MRGRIRKRIRPRRSRYARITACITRPANANHTVACGLYTLVGEDNFRAVVVTSVNIFAVSQPIKGDTLNEKALELWALLQSDKYDPSVLSEQLYATVFKPIEAQLPKDTSTIIWMLDGNLRYLPMGALYDGKQYLVERYNHVVATHADRERLLRRVSAKWTGLGLGSSQAHTVELLGEKISFNPLPGVSEGLQALFKQQGSTRGLLDGEVLPDTKFTKVAMLNALKQHHRWCTSQVISVFAPATKRDRFCCWVMGQP